MNTSKAKSRVKVPGAEDVKLPKLHMVGFILFITSLIMTFDILVCLWVQSYTLTADSTYSFRTAFKLFMTEKKVYLMVGFLSFLAFLKPAQWIMDLTTDPRAFFLGNEKSSAYNPNLYYFVWSMIVMCITAMLVAYSSVVTPNAFLVKLLSAALPGILLILMCSILFIALCVWLIHHLKKYVT